MSWVDDSSKPLVISSLEDQGKYLNRLELGLGDNRSESWLQELIHDHPSILPVSDFDSSFSPLVSIAREVVTGVGRIDNLLVSPSGKIVIVETKLWKNPEKHRDVVAQIIGYAKALSQWNYDKLSQIVPVTTPGSQTDNSDALFNRVRNGSQQAGELNFHDFESNVTKCLETGDFLLLIVGDRISANVALLADAIQGAPGLEFTIGLVELQIYSLDESEQWPILVFPHVVGRTVERTRAVVKVRYAGPEKPELSISTPQETTEIRSGKINPDTFLSELPDNLVPVFEMYLEKWLKGQASLSWGKRGFSVGIDIAGKRTPLVNIFPDYMGLVRLSDIKDMPDADAIYEKYWDKIQSVSEATQLLQKNAKYIHFKSLSEDEIMVLLEALDGLFSTPV